MLACCSSVRGAGGGFALARPAAEISLADIVEAVEGPIAMTVCSGHEDPSDCALDAHCRVKPHMGIVGNGGSRRSRCRLADSYVHLRRQVPSLS